MIRNFRIYFISLIFFYPFFIVSCSAQKEQPTSKNNKTTHWKAAELPERQQLKFENLFFEATKEKQLGNTDKAIKAFEKCIEVNAKSAVIYYELAGLYMSNNQVEEALTNAQKAVDLDNNNKWYLIRLASYHQINGDLKEASDLYAKIIDLAPDDPENYFQLASLLIYQNDNKGALKIYDKIEDKFGVMPEVSLNKQRLYLNMNEVSKATDELKKLIDAYPQELDFYKLLAEVYKNNGYDKEALDVYQQMLDIDSLSGDVLLSLAEFYEDKDKAKSLEYLDKAFSNPAIDVDKKIKIVYRNYLVNGPSEDKKEESLKLAKIIVDSHPSEAKAHALYADLLYQYNQLKEARESYKKSLEFNQSIYAVWQQLILIDSELKDYDAMADDSKNAFEYFPNQASVYLFNGIANMQLKNYEDAIDIFNTGLDYAINNKPLQSQFYSNIAETYHRMNKYEESDKNFEKALELDPNDPLVLNNYSYYLSLRNEKLDEALKMSKKSLELEPDNSAYLDTYGWILFKQGNYEEAEDYIRQALQRSPKDAELLEHLGDILFKANKMEEAIETWEKAKENGGDPAALDKKIQERKL